jgi:hypothetical protein
MSTYLQNEEGVKRERRKGDGRGETGRNTIAGREGGWVRKRGEGVSHVHSSMTPPAAALPENTTARGNPPT